MNQSPDTDSAVQSDAKTPLRALVVMGVSGCGKSSVGEAIATRLGWTLLEGDDYHSPESVAKMAAGIPLTDADRSGWLTHLVQLLGEKQQGDHGVVLTCSALRLRYRDRLRQAAPRLGFVFLKLDYSGAVERVRNRSGHLFPPTLVASQFEALEPPDAEPDVLMLDATSPVAALAECTIGWVQAAERAAFFQGTR